MMTVERQNYVLNILQALRKRCAALNQWFDQVIKDTLVVDYSKARIDYEQKSKQLKLERVRLLQEKIKEKTGQDVKVNIPDMVSDKDKNDVNLNPIVNQPINGVSYQLELFFIFSNILHLPLKSHLKTKDGKNKGSQEITEKPINSYDLPPPPSRDQILGNVERIKQDYFEQTENWNKHLDASKRDADERLNKVLSQYKDK